MGDNLPPENGISIWGRGQIELRCSYNMPLAHSHTHTHLHRYKDTHTNTQTHVTHTDKGRQSQMNSHTQTHTYRHVDVQSWNQIRDSVSLTRMQRPTHIHIQNKHTHLCYLQYFKSVEVSTCMVIFWLCVSCVCRFWCKVVEVQQNPDGVFLVCSICMNQSNVFIVKLFGNNTPWS